MKRLRLFSAAILSLLYVQPSVGQNINTMGTDFWVGFMDNYDNRLGSNMLKVLISAPRDCTATLSNPNTGYSFTINCVANNVATIYVPQTQGYTSSSCTVTSTGLHLVSSDTVSVYASTMGITNYEVTNVFPTNVLRDEYLLQSYPSDRYGSEFKVIATEDNTFVDIVLTSATNAGIAGDTVTVHLPRAGSCYQVKSNPVGDFSGTRVKARDCKRIAVLQGSLCSYIPAWSEGCTCDHLVEQSVPINYWGKEFIVVNTGTSHSDRLRITSLYDSCMVRINSLLVTTLDAGETYETELNGTTTARIIKTSKPSSVNLYFSSTFNQGVGDPSMVTISPVEQMMRKVIFASFNSSYTFNHYIMIVARTSDRNSILLDGNAITQNFSVSTTNPTYSYAKISVSAGSHTLECVNGQGFIAYAYGMGQHESYAYSVGANMVDLTNSIFANGQRIIASNSTVEICQHDTISFVAVASDQTDSIEWHFDDGTTLSGDTVSADFHTDGIFNGMCIFNHNAVSNCFTTSNDTILFTVNVHKSDTVLYDTSVCDLPINWHNTLIDSVGSNPRTYLNAQGCRSLQILNLSLLPKSDTTIYVHGCDSVVLQGNAFYHDTTISLPPLTNSYGCDSITNIVPVVHPSYLIGVDVVLRSGDSVEWIDGGIYDSPDQHPQVHFTSVYGCDSIVELNIHMLPTPENDSSSLWVPNVFTPNENNNTQFRIFGHHLIKAQVYIFARDGNFVTQFDGLTDSWDGTYKGKPCPMNAYTYLVEYYTKNKPRTKQIKKGTVFLLR